MNLTEVINELRRLNETVPEPLRLPTEAEVSAAEQQLHVRFSEDYRRYLLEASDVIYGSLEPAVVIPDSGYLNLVEVATTAWNEQQLPHHLLPICEDNGDYYCLNEKGEVQFWSHNGLTDEKWNDLATWIREVWIEGD